MAKNNNSLELNQDEKIIRLGEAIKKGNEGLIPYEFIYPDTDNKVGVKLRPITNIELKEALQNFKANGTTLDIETLKIALFDIDDTLIPEEVINELPAGVVSELSLEIGRISGIKTNKTTEKEIINDLMGF